MLLNVGNIYHVLSHHLFEWEYNKKKLLLINTSFLPVELTQYLMQPRFEEDDKNQDRLDKELPCYQEGMYWMQKENDYYHAAVAWHTKDANNIQVTICSPWLQIIDGFNACNVKNVKQDVYQFESEHTPTELLTLLIEQGAFKKIKKTPSY